jgi:hypothetical protein
MPTNRQFVIDHLPTGKLTPDVFKAAESAIPSPGDGEVLVRTRYISLDAANRAWMWGATYRAAIKAGDHGVLLLLLRLLLVVLVLVVVLLLLVLLRRRDGSGG